MSIYSTTITAIQPSAICAGENPVIYQLGTAAVGTATFAKGKLKVLLATTQYSTITITGATGYAKTFTGSYFPNRDDLFLTDTLQDQNGNSITTTINTTQIAGSIAQCLIADEIISKNYFINYSGSTIIELVAKEAGSKWDLSNKVSLYSYSAGAKFSFTVLSTGANAYQGEQIPDYYLTSDIYVGNNSVQPQLVNTVNMSNFNRVTEIALPYSNDNIHKFDISTISKNFLGTPIPDFSITGHTTDENTKERYLKPFLIQYGEQYPLIPGQNTVKKFIKGRTGMVWVCNASLPFGDVNTMIPYSGYSTNVSFLTNSPAIKESTRTGYELLYFIALKNLTADLSVWADLTFWDGSVLTGQTLYNIIANTNNYGGLYSINVSHKHHLKPIEISTGQKIKTAKISVNKYGVNFKYTKTKTLSFPFKDASDSFGVAFQNSLGTFDCFDFHGIQEETIDRTKGNLTFPINPNQNGSFTNGFKSSADYDVQVTKKVTVNSGWINQAHFDWLIELLSSNTIYSTDNGLNYLKLDGYKYSKNNQNSDYNIEVTFIQTIFENNVTI